MSATGSVNLIVLLLLVARLLRSLYSSSPKNQRRPVIRPASFVVARPLIPAPARCSCERRRADDLRLFYQDDFETPGISPRKAKPRKHKRQMPNLRIYARGRPQILQRLCLRVENFGFFTCAGLTLLSAPSFTRFAVVAT
jgi:hypothetical protein